MMGINANSLQGKLKGNEKDAFMFTGIMINVIQPITFEKLSAAACWQPCDSGQEENKTTYSLLDVNC